MAQNSHAGRASSWLAVIVIWIGFGVGGAALVPEPKWWLFWTGTGIVVVGGVVAAVVRLYGDDKKAGHRQAPEERDHGERADWYGTAAFEYWALAACVLPIEDWPLYAFRRRAYIERGQQDLRGDL